MNEVSQLELELSGVFTRWASRMSSASGSCKIIIIDIHHNNIILSEVSTI